MASNKTIIKKRSGSPTTTPEEIIDFMNLYETENATPDKPMTLHSKVVVHQNDKVTKLTIMNKRFALFKPDLRFDLKFHTNTENLLDLLLKRQPRILTYITLKSKGSVPLNVFRAGSKKYRDLSYHVVKERLNPLECGGLDNFTEKCWYANCPNRNALTTNVVRTTLLEDILPSLLSGVQEGLCYFVPIIRLDKIPRGFIPSFRFKWIHKRRDGKLLVIQFQILSLTQLTPTFSDLCTYVELNDYPTVLDAYMSYCASSYYRSIFQRNFLTAHNKDDIPTMINYLLESPLIKAQLEITTQSKFDVRVFMSEYEMARSMNSSYNEMFRSTELEKISAMSTDYARWTKETKKYHWWETNILSSGFARTSVGQNDFGFGAHISFGTFILRREWSYLVHYIDENKVANDYFGLPKNLPVQWALVLGQKIFQALTLPVHIPTVAFSVVTTPVPDGYAWSATVLAKMIMSVGLPPLENATFKRKWKKVKLCPLCYTMVLDGEFASVKHCKTTQNMKEIKLVLDWLGELESIFNYWFQRCLQINDPKWNSLLWLAMNYSKDYQFPYSPAAVARGFFRCDVTYPTMFKIVGDARQALAEVTDMSNVVRNGVDRVVDVVDQVQSNNLISRVTNTLDNLDHLLPQASMTSGLTDYLGVFDNMLTGSIIKFATNIFPFFDLDMFPRISFCNVLRDYILQKHVNNGVIKSLIFIDMFKNAGVFEVLCEFFQGFKDMETCSPTKTNFTEVTSAITSMLSGTFDWSKNAILMVAGFVRVISPKACMKRLFEWIKDAGNLFRGVNNIAMGVNSMETLCFNVQKCYYLAKKYVCDKLGIECDLPIYIRLKENMTDWCACVTTLCTPAHRNPIVSSEEAWPIVDDLFMTGLKLLKHTKGNNALSGTVSRLLKDLTCLKSQISCVRGLCPYVFVPLVIHLNGPVKIGKSAVLSLLLKAIAGTLGLNPKPYVYNETLRFMDGYAAEEIVICDDVNLSKDPDLSTWLIKLVSPNLCTLPVAENEARPQISNVKLIVLTSNVAYSSATGLATHKGIDRRSEFKFEVSSDFYDTKRHCVVKPKDVDWVNVHKFVRIPSVQGATMSPREMFEGNSETFFEWMLTEATDYFTREKRRVVDAAGDFRFGGQVDEIKKALVGAMAFGNEQLDLSTIRERVEAMKIRTAGGFITTVNPEQSAAINLAVKSMKFDMSMNEFSHLATNLQIYDWHTSYPRFVNDVIKFDANYVDECGSVNWVNTTYLYGKPFNYLGVAYDRYFLEHLQVTSDEFHITDYWPRVAFKDELQPRKTYLFDHIAYESLLKDSSFMESWKQFFSLPLHARLVLYTRYKIAMLTRRLMHKNTTSWSARINNLIKNIFSVDVMWKSLLGLYICFIVICVAVAIVELMTSLLVYNTVKDAVVESTSNPPRPVTGPSNIKTHVTSNSAFSKNYHDVSLKVTRNIYSCRFHSPNGTLYGTFNGIFLSERYLLINWHCISGLTLEHAAGDQDMLVVRIFVPAHNEYIKYHFKRSSIVRIPNKDAVVIYVTNFPVQISILKNWTETGLSDADISSPVNCHYHDLSSLCISSGHYLRLLPAITYANPSDLSSYVNNYCCSYTSSRGSSGGAVMIDSNSHSRKIIGIQASESGFSYAQALSLAELENAIEYISSVNRIKVTIPTCDVPYTEVFDLDHPSQIGVVSKEYAVTISNKTALKKTPWFGIIVDPPDRTPVFRRVHREDLYNYVDKNDKVLLKPFDPTILQATVEEYAKYFQNVIISRAGVVPTSILSLQQAVSGSYIGGKSIDLSASPGIGKGNWIKNRVKGGSRDLITLDVSGNYLLSDALTFTVSELLGQLMTGEVTTSTYASFPKDELRPDMKDARGIDGAPIEQKLIYKMLFGRIDGLINSLNDGTIKYGPGINLFSPSGVNLISRMTEHVCMWDFSKYDSSINQQMYDAVVDFYNILSRDDEFSTARRTLAHITCNATIVADDKVYQPCRGMRSGFGGTSTFNTHVHNIFIILAVKQLLRGYSRCSPTIHDVFDIVDWITYSDDGLLWLKDPQYHDVVNGETIAGIFKSYGLTVADPRGKSSLPPPFVSLSESVFLKQSPYFDSYLGVYCWRCNCDCISSAFSYYSGDDPFEPVDCAFSMLWPYGPVTFTDAVKKFNKQSDQFKKSYTATWDDLLANYKALFDQMPYPSGIICKLSS